MCEECDAGKYGEVVGANQLQCTSCPLDWFSGEDGASACAECPDGWATDSARRSCDACPGGKFERDATRSCESCPAKWASAGGLATCTECGEGEVTGSARAACSKCAPGTHALVADRSNCRNCPAAWVAGFGADACATCPAGFKASGVTSCDECAAGKRSSGDPPSTCAQCDAGQWSAGRSDTCATCPAGKAVSADQTMCEVCEAGEYGAAVAGLLQCTACPLDWFSGEDGASACAECPAGWATDSARRSCDACAGGKFERDATRSCESCPAKWASAGGRAACTACATGEVTVNGGAACQVCSPGSHAVVADRASCSPCSPGKVAGFGEDECSECSRGTYPNKAKTACEACGGGQYLSNATCTKCSAGKAAEEGSAQCTPCPRGHISNSDGASTCVKCSEGRFSNVEGAFECQACPTRGATCDKKAGTATINADWWHKPVPGFRLTADTALYPCLSPEMCIFDSDDHENVTCNIADGYKGILCGECSKEPTDDAPYGYTRRGTFCTPCNSVGVSAAWFALSFFVVWASLVVKAAHTSGKGESISEALWRVFISYYGICAAAGEFKARGSELFVEFTEAFTRLAAAVDIGFEPVVCSGWWYSMIFLSKAVAPYVLILCVGCGLPCYVNFRKYRKRKAGKPIDEDDNIPMQSRLIGALVFVMYYLFPTTIISLFKTFYCTEPPVKILQSTFLD